MKRIEKPHRKVLRILNAFSPKAFEYDFRQVFWLIPYFCLLPVNLLAVNSGLDKAFRTYSCGNSSGIDSMRAISPDSLFILTIPSGNLKIEAKIVF